MALRRGRESRKIDTVDEYEFYEDTHNERGEYIGKNNNQSFDGYNDINIRAPQNDSIGKNDNVAMPMGNGQRIIVYFPKSPEDVMVLIKHLKMNNPAVVNLEDDIDEGTAQRILDFLAGAVCALSGSVHKISGNLFLLSPQGVEITIPYEKK